MTPIILSNDQQKVYDSLIEVSSGAYLITGFAGTGKTFLAAEIIKTFIKENKKVLCLAPTHQAKMQLQSSIPKDADCRTIASFLKIKAERDPVNGMINFVRGSITTEDADQYRLLVIDECSMISEDELKLILKLKNKIPLIFLGDFNQLPPVNRKDGKEIFEGIKQYDLTEQHRNSGDVLKLCNTLRHEVKLPSISNDEIQIYNSRNKFLEDLIIEITTNPDPYNICYLGFTNREVKEIRNTIQDILHGNNDIHLNQYLRLETKVGEFNVSEIVEVLKLQKKNIFLCGKQYECFECELENIFTGKTLTAKIMSYNEQDILEEDLQELYKVAEFAYNKIIKAKRNRANNNEIQRLENDHKELLRVIKETDQITRVSSPFALTIHKSQGRTIPVVYLDTIDLIKYGRENKRALMYVGCSRTKDNLKILK